MAEDSAYWAGEITGDAASVDVWDAPYTSLEWSDIWKKSLASDVNYGLVVPDYDNELEVTAKSPVSMNVAVDSGVMFIRGKMYENTTSNDLAIGANASGNPRIDRVIIRISFAAQTIRMAILAGTPGVAPALPTLTQNAVTYEVPIAYIWVPNGAASIPDTDIHDERTFSCSAGNVGDVIEAVNLIQNSEFMAFSQLSGGATTNPPDSWDLTGTPSDIDEDTAPSQMIRSRSVAITSDAANEGIEQTFLVKASTSYAIKLLTYVTAGDVGSIVVTTDAGTPGTITRYTRREATWVEELIYYTTEADATEMTVQLLCLSSGDIIKYGQVLVLEGHIPGPFRPVAEQIYFTEPITDTSWDGDSKSTGTTTIDLDADFQSLILPDVKNVLAVLTAQDTTTIGTNILTEYDVANQDVGVPLRGPSGAGATETIDQTGTSALLGDLGGTEYWQAQSFQCTAGRLSQITVTLDANAGTPVGDITWEIQTDAAGPSGSVLQTGSYTPVPSAQNTITVTNGIFLAAGTTYWLVQYPPNQAAGNGYKWVGKAVGTYANGQRAYSTNGGGTWNLDAYDLKCSITTSPVSVGDKLAQSFQIGSASNITGAKLYLKKVGAPTGTMTLRIETDNAGDPSGILADANATITFTEASLTTNYVLETFAFAATFSLASGTSYWLVLSTTRATSTTNYVLWGADASAPSYASGEMKSEAAAAWSAESKDACFQVYLTITALVAKLAARRYGQTTDIVLNSLSGLADSVDYQGQGWVAVDRDNRFDLYVLATTTASMDCDVKLLGIDI